MHSRIVDCFAHSGPTLCPTHRVGTVARTHPDRRVLGAGLPEFSGRDPRATSSGSLAGGQNPRGSQPDCAITPTAFFCLLPRAVISNGLGGSPYVNAFEPEKL